jgi:hypothetical protein
MNSGSPPRAGEARPVARITRDAPARTAHCETRPDRLANPKASQAQMGPSATTVERRRPARSRNYRRHDSGSRGSP